jgi:hypothetical protein
MSRHDRLAGLTTARGCRERPAVEGTGFAIHRAPRPGRSRARRARGTSPEVPRTTRRVRFRPRERTAIPRRAAHIIPHSPAVGHLAPVGAFMSWMPMDVEPCNRVSAGGRGVRLSLGWLVMPSRSDQRRTGTERLWLAPGTRQPVTPAPEARRFGTPSCPRILHWMRSWGSSSRVKEPPHHGSRED